MFTQYIVDILNVLISENLWGRMAIIHKLFHMREKRVKILSSGKRSSTDNKNDRAQGNTMTRKSNQRTSTSPHIEDTLGRNLLERLDWSGLSSWSAARAIRAPSPGWCNPAARRLPTCLPTSSPRATIHICTPYIQLMILNQIFCILHNYICDLK